MAAKAGGEDLKDWVVAQLLAELDGVLVCSLGHFMHMDCPLCFD